MALKMSLVGSGIQHSRMPQLQEYLGKLAGVEVSYSRVDGSLMDEFDPTTFVRQAISEGYSGLNITHPYKQAIVPLVDEACVDGHELIGSYNTLKFENSEVLAANTDFSGFIRTYNKYREEQSPGKVYLVGAGGVGRAIALALARLGCTELFIHDRQEAQAASLAGLLQQQGVNARTVHDNETSYAIRHSTGLVNCTQVGMYNHPGSAINLALIGDQQWAFDAVYTPMGTAFLKSCREKNLQCLSGFDLWLYQGVDAFRIFTGKDIEPDVMLTTTARGWLD